MLVYSLTRSHTLSLCPSKFFPSRTLPWKAVKSMWVASSRTSMAMSLYAGTTVRQANVISFGTLFDSFFFFILFFSSYSHVHLCAKIRQRILEHIYIILSTKFSCHCTISNALVFKFDLFVLGFVCVIDFKRRGKGKDGSWI